MEAAIESPVQEKARTRLFAQTEADLVGVTIVLTKMQTPHSSEALTHGPTRAWGEGSNDRLHPPGTSIHRPASWGEENFFDEETWQAIDAVMTCNGLTFQGTHRRSFQGRAEEVISRWLHCERPPLKEGHE